MTLFKNKYRIESARLKGWDYSAQGYYFVTLCTRERVCCLGAVIDAEAHVSPIGEIVAEEWLKTEEVRKNMRMDEWIIMPNHLHGIVVIEYVINPPTVEVNPSRLKPNSIGSMMGQIKGNATKRIRAAGFADFDWQERFGMKLFGRNAGWTTFANTFATILRNGKRIATTRQGYGCNGFVETFRGNVSRRGEYRTRAKGTSLGVGNMIFFRRGACGQEGETFRGNVSGARQSSHLRERKIVVGWK